MNHDDLRDLLALTAVAGIGPGKLRALISAFGSPGAIRKASPRRLATVPGIDHTLADRLQSGASDDFAEAQLSACERSGTTLVSFWDDTYPAALKQIYDPPILLFTQGNGLDKSEYSIAVVGTRRPSNYGRLMAERLTGDLARRGLTVVSGLAYGIDTTAHQTALEAGGVTIAVLGSGVDVIYPAENRTLARKLCGCGALISELPMGSKPDRANFPRRNRIICGLSMGIIVVEAGEKSGALITAYLALEQNREVFAVPGNADSKLSVGCHQLIRQGARLVTDAAEVVDELYPRLKPALDASGERRSSPPGVSLTEPETVVLGTLSAEPVHIDAISGSAGLSTSETLSILLSLELKNVVKQLPGKLFVRA